MPSNDEQLEGEADRQRLGIDGRQHRARKDERVNTEDEQERLRDGRRVSAKCAQCNESLGDRDDDTTPDPCLGWLPGVDAACCGHGTGLPYLKFTDGTTLYFPGGMFVARRQGAAPLPTYRLVPLGGDTE